MPKQKHRPPPQLDSLIPTIKTEEKRLDDLLVETRAQSERIVREAQEQAAARVASARQSLPDLLRKERDARRAAMEKKAADAAAQEEAQARRAEERARAAMDAAVQLIVSRVWPGSAGRRQGGGARA
jgi:vacuolar-type H+-ATPase subunit H